MKKPQRSLVTNGLLGLCLSSLVVALTGCAPEFWDGFGKGLADAQRNAYAPNAGTVDSEETPRRTICARYMTEAGWSHGYQVSASIISGAELNRRTGTFNYRPYSTYAVIFWAQGEASVLELQYYLGSVGPIGLDAKDQEGRTWHVAETPYCY